MTQGMSHDEARELLMLAALTGEEHLDAESHVTGCPECLREVAKVRNIVGALAYAVPATPMDSARSGRLRERLLGRAADAAKEASVFPLRARPESARVARHSIAPWLAAAALAIAAVGLATYSLSTRRQVAGLSGELAAAQRNVDSLRASLEARDRLLAGLISPRVRVVELAATGPKPPTARMFWDQASDTWTFVAHNLANAPTGRTYQLWLITPDQRKLSAGTFVPDSTGTAVVRAQYPLAADSLFMVAVTDEPAGGVPQPTGSIILAGKAD